MKDIHSHVFTGEISAAGFDKIDAEKIARQVVKKIGYDDPAEGFSWEKTNRVKEFLAKL